MGVKCCGGDSIATDKFTQIRNKPASAIISEFGMCLNQDC